MPRPTCALPVRLAARCATLVLVLLCANAVPAASARLVPMRLPPLRAADSTMEVVRRALAAERLQGARWPRIVDVARDLRRAYDSAAWAPLWLREGRPTPQALEVVRYLAAVDSVGLRPGDYDARGLDSLRTLLDQGESAEVAGRFEITLSVAVARTLASLQWGRVAPRDVHEAFDIPRLDYDLPTAVLTAARAPRPGYVFDGAQPRLRPYVLLKEQLRRYRSLAADTAVRLVLPAIRRVAPGDVYSGAASLRRLLIAFGDLATDLPLPPADADSVYTEELAAAVRAFQARHGATADGILGTATRAELLLPLEKRIQQIELALERWRWLPREFGGRVVMVNVPEFRLHAFDRLTSDSTELFSMDVAVGDAYDHRTPIFRKELEYLVLAPYWEVPTSIAVKEIRPKSVRDPGWLRRNRYVLAEAGSERPVPITAANVARIGRGVRVRQLPGPNNALGRVKFMLPNRHNIYLHDTPSQQAFARSRRDVSHGCIRLADPLRLATWLLRNDPEWDLTRLEEAMNTRTTPLNVALPERVPVLVVYGTAVATLAGGIHFLPDIYKHDLDLSQHLATGYPYPR